jgi:hypothetical protein
MNKIEFALTLAKDCTYADEMTEGAKEHLRKKIDEAIEELIRMSKQIKLPSEKEIKKHIDSLPYYGHCTDEYKEGFEDGIKWIKQQIKNQNKEHGA